MWVCCNTNGGSVKPSKATQWPWVKWGLWLRWRKGVGEGQLTQR